MKNNIHHILLRIDELCEQYGWNHYRLAKASEIPLASLNSMFARNTLPTIPTLEKICNGFHISLKEFFEYDIRPKAPELSLDEMRLVDRYRTLSRTEKGLLGAYLDGLQRRDLAKSPEEHSGL